MYCDLFDHFLCYFFDSGSSYAGYDNKITDCKSYQKSCMCNKRRIFIGTIF